ncbi:MAG: cell division protein ZapA [Geobacteraceae bacterium]|nr:cell division protein ZapA [Geobacteraceae bacterium]
MHRIRVLGRELQVRSTALPETVQEIEALVNGKLSEVASSVTGGDTQIVAILTLMTLAEEYLSLRSEYEAVRQHDAERVAKLLDKLGCQL